MTGPTGDARAAAAVGASEEAPSALRWWQLPEVLRLERTLFPADPWSEAQWWSELAGVPGRRAIAAAWRPGTDQDAPAPGDLLGFVDVALTRDMADLQTLAVAEPAQGTGLGRKLLDTGMSQAREHGCQRMLLEVRAGNARAIALYAASGFTQIDRRSGYYSDGADAVIMQAELA